MIENLMVLALGVLAASLVWLALLGAVWRRAVRLTTKRLHGSVPMSMVDIKADKDHLRAEFAVALRKQELANEQMREALNTRAITIATRDEALRDAHETIGLRDSAIEGLNQTLAERAAELAAREKTLAETQAAWQASEAELNEARDEIAALTRANAALQAEIDAQRVEAVAHTTRIDNLTLSQTVSAKELAALAAERDRLHAAHGEATEALTRERQALYPLQEDLRQTKATLAERESALAELRAALDELTASHARLTETAKQGGEQIAVLERALADTENARQTLASAHEALRRESEDATKALDARMAELLTEKTLAEGALAKAREDRDALHATVTHLRQNAGGLSGESIDQALLRDTISDIAAKVAALAAAREGEGSPIDAILARAPAGEGLTLADKVRALRA